MFETARNIVNHSTGAIHCGCYKHLPIKKIEDIISRYFLRMEVEDKPGFWPRWPACWEIIPSASSRWCRRKKSGDDAEIVVITNHVRERHLRDALLTFQNMSVVRSIPSLIRVYG